MQNHRTVEQHVLPFTEKRLTRFWKLCNSNGYYYCKIIYLNRTLYLPLKQWKFHKEVMHASHYTSSCAQAQR